MKAKNMLSVGWMALVAHEYFHYTNTAEQAIITKISTIYES